MFIHESSRGLFNRVIFRRSARREKSRRFKLLISLNLLILLISNFAVEITGEVGEAFPAAGIRRPAYLMHPSQPSLDPGAYQRDENSRECSITRAGSPSPRRRLPFFPSPRQHVV